MEGHSSGADGHMLYNCWRHRGCGDDVCLLISSPVTDKVSIRSVFGAEVSNALQLKRARLKHVTFLGEPGHKWVGLTCRNNLLVKP